jgi:hypothetical protein
MKRTAVAGSAILIGVGVAASALAAESAGAPLEGSQAAAASAYSSQLTCKRERQMGSNIPRTVCRTKAQIDAERAAAEAFNRDMNQRKGIKPPAGTWQPP